MKVNIKAAIFDMDGTLIDSLIFWDLLWSDLGKVYLNNIPEGDSLASLIG